MKMIEEQSSERGLKPRENFNVDPEEKSLLNRKHLSKNSEQMHRCWSEINEKKTMLNRMKATYQNGKSQIKKRDSDLCLFSS